MGLEYIVQPQVFVGGLTALGPGIQGLTENYPLLTTYYSWTSTASVDASVFPIPLAAGSIYDGPGKESSFIISIGNVIQSPTEYTVDPILRTITFGSAVSAGIELAATQLATAAPSSQNFDYVKSVSAEFTTLTATNGAFDTLVVTNLTALSTVVNIIDIQVSEVSGFRATGDVEVLGNINVTNNINLTGNLVAEDITSTNATFTNLTATDFTTSNLIVSNPVNSLTVTALSADTALITSPILSTDNSTQVATTNFVRQFGGFQNIAVYTSGTGTVDLSSLGEGIEKIKVTVLGGGGGGGGTRNIADRCGAGGGSGGCAIGYFNNTANTSFTYVVGAGGSGGGQLANGASGETSAFTLENITLSGGGGEGGAFGDGAAVVLGGNGGIATGGILNFNGSPGGAGHYNSATDGLNVTGFGANSMFAGGARGVLPTANPVNGNSAAPNSGAGGSGGGTNGATAGTGGDGGSGIIIVEY